MSGIPYFSIPSSSALPIQPFGLMALFATGAAATATALIGRKRGIAGGQLGLIVPLAVVATLIGSHLFDVAWYRWSDASADPKLWIQFQNGLSLVGGIGGAAIIVFALARKSTHAIWADVAGFGFLFGLAIARIGCTLVHDHPGKQTDLPIGVDFPFERAQWSLEPYEADVLVDNTYRHPATVRLHDVGFEELVLLIPIVIAGALLLRRHLRPGLTGAILAIAYACIRFPLDFLRAPRTEPTQLGLTGGQWGMLVVLALGVVAAVLIQRRPEEIPPAIVKP